METTNLSNLKINVLTPEQYETAEKNANELYLIGNDTSFLSIVTKEYVDNSIANQTTETWTFTLSDGSTVAKDVVIK